MRMNAYNAERVICSTHGYAHDLGTECYWCEGIRLEREARLPPKPKKNTIYHGFVALPSHFCVSKIQIGDSVEATDNTIWFVTYAPPDITEVELTTDHTFLDTWESGITVCNNVKHKFYTPPDLTEGCSYYSKNILHYVGAINTLGLSHFEDLIRGR